MLSLEYFPTEFWLKFLNDTNLPMPSDSTTKIQTWNSVVGKPDSMRIIQYSHQNSVIILAEKVDGFNYCCNNSRLGDSFKPTLNVEPTDTFEDELRITEAGFDLVLYHAPG